VRRFAMEKALSGAVRVATLNLWGRHGAWDERRSVLSNGLRELGADVMAFQEAIVGDGYDQVSDLLGPGFYVHHQAGREADGSGLSIASRWPLGEVREEVLDPTTRVAPSRMAVAEVLAPGTLGPLLLAHHNASWQLGFEHERELQAVAAAHYVEEVAGRRDATHVVLAGDFNAVPDSAGLRFWRGLQSLGDTSVCYRDGWESAHPGEEGHTFTPRNPLVSGGEWALEPGRRIDYVMVRCGHRGPTLEVVSCERIFDEPADGVWASDHFGVVADFRALVPGGRPVL
jgi:endonuclease/exonuclease/phosphatase family metal-dependent hydrolase